MRLPTVIKHILASTGVLFAVLNYAWAQQAPLPHGMVFGTKPSTVGLMPAGQLESFMGKRTRTSASVVGKVLKVTRPKGGWFTLDADSGRMIKAHFKQYNVVLPTALKGREVIVQGVATRQFIADDKQHLAGDTAANSKRKQQNNNSRSQLVFEVTGLMVNK